MTDISNKALALLLLVAIAVSVWGTVVSFRNPGTPIGRATDSDSSGKTNFSIQSALSIRFVERVIPFGTGYVNTSFATRCVMGTNNSPPTAVGSGCANFNTTVHTSNLTIENDGNLKANVSLNFTANATTFIGGTNPSFMFEVTNAEASSCQAINNGSTFREVNNGTDVNATASRICTNLSSSAASNLIAIGLWVRIPEDATQGEHTVTLTAVGCDDGSC